MCYWDDETYFEPSEFDEKIEELKEALRQSVRQEIKDEVEKLRAENKKLQGIKENFEEVKRDYERKKEKCDRAIQSAEYKAKHARLEELMELYRLTMWSVTWDNQYKKKCDKCNEFRRIRVTLPSGTVVNDECECDRSKKVYLPKENILYEISGRYGETRAWYKKRESEDEYHIYSEYASTIVDRDMDFQKIDRGKLRQVFFKTKEECQEFCDYLNAEDDVSEYKYDVAGRLITQEKDGD